MTRIRDNGTVYARGTKFQVSRTLAYRVEEDDRLLIYDTQGTLLAEYPRPIPVGLGSESLHNRGA